MSVTPEGHCHVIDGTADCVTSQGSISWSRKSSFTHSHGESTDDVWALFAVESLEEEVVSEPYGFAIFAPPFPRPRVVVLCSSLYRSCTGSLSSREVTKEEISLGRGTILKGIGTCEGT